MLKDELESFNEYFLNTGSYANYTSKARELAKRFPKSSSIKYLSKITVARYFRYIKGKGNSPGVMRQKLSYLVNLLHYYGRKDLVIPTKLTFTEITGLKCRIVAWVIPPKKQKRGVVYVR